MVADKKKKGIGRVITYIILTIVAFVCAFPFYWMLTSALKPKAEIRKLIPTMYPHAPTLENFKTVLFQTGFSGYMKNSLIVASATTLVSMVLAIMAGYALSRYYKRKFVRAASMGMTVSQMIPGVLLLVPLYMIMFKLGMLESYFSLILANSTFVLPLSTFMMSSFFDTVPLELEESAEIDGCGKVKTIVRIILPVSVPSLISTGLYAFISAWNEFLFAYVFLSTEKYRTITPAIKLFKGVNTTNWGALTAASVLGVVPITLIFMFLQKYFIAGLMSGSVKG
ncbi:carbohydrate ABC transporter permease [Blautia producta]|uniref:carbohydrate ABC transporter permease n=1 Tax=Blautia producta TaxID=33035 RepID=UPI0031B58AAD